MLDKLVSTWSERKSRDTAFVAAGMLATLAGRKVLGVSLFAKGLYGLEKAWREAHPDFQGGMDARWQAALELYNETHQEPTNRKLHAIGIPMIVGGTAGLLLFPAYRPAWWVAAGSFTAGWILNFIGHGKYERNRPAFADDPLSFLAGPVWDFRQLFGQKERKDAAASGARAAEAPPSGHPAAAQA